MPRTATKRRATWPGNKQCLADADAALSRPPAKPWIVRAEPVGQLVWRCVVPAEWCLDGNAYSRKHFRVRAALKDRIFAHMLAQHGLRKREAPLEGRPFVRAIRFTASEPDITSDWAKMPVDCLIADWVRRGGPRSKTPGAVIKTHEGVGFLRDDRPELCELHCHWEPGKRGRGFVLIDVYGGE